MLTTVAAFSSWWVSKGLPASPVTGPHEMPQLDSFGFPLSSCFFTVLRANAPSSLHSSILCGSHVTTALLLWLGSCKQDCLISFLQHHCITSTFRMCACVRSLAVCDLVGSRKPLLASWTMSLACLLHQTALLTFATRIHSVYLA